MKNNGNPCAQHEPSEVRAARNLIASHYTTQGAHERAAAIRGMTLRDAVGTVLADLAAVRQLEQHSREAARTASLSATWSRLRERVRAWTSDNP